MTLDAATTPGRPGTRGPSKLVRAAVVQATLGELAEGGYPALSLEKVARRAGVAKTTLYRRWGTRESLVLEAMLERAQTHITVPDTGSLREDLLTFVIGVVANASSPEVSAMARAVVAGLPHDSRLASASRRFWADRLDLGSGPSSDGPSNGTRWRPRPTLAQVIEAVIGPIHLRLLLTGEPVDRGFLEATVDTVLAGIVRRGGGAAG